MGDMPNRDKNSREREKIAFGEAVIHCPFSPCGLYVSHSCLTPQKLKTLSALT